MSFVYDGNSADAVMLKLPKILGNWRNRRLLCQHSALTSLLILLLVAAQFHFCLYGSLATHIRPNADTNGRCRDNFYLFHEYRHFIAPTNNSHALIIVHDNTALHADLDFTVRGPSWIKA